MMEYYTTMKKSRVVIHTTVWMNPTDTTLRDRSQVQKRASCMWNSRTGKIIFICRRQVDGSPGMGEWEGAGGKFIEN